MKALLFKRNLVIGLICLFVELFFLMTLDAKADGNILVYATEDGHGSIYNRTVFDTNLPSILGDHGYSVTVTDRIITPTITSSLLSSYDELWIMSSKRLSTGVFSTNEINTILDFRNAGKGLLIMADHYDYVADANQISVPLGVTFYGSANHGPSGGLIQPEFQTHPLFTGVTTIVAATDEGQMNVNSPVQVVATYQGDNLIALLDDGNGRVVFDVSFTRLWDDGVAGLNWVTVGNTPQYVRNIADWLMPANQPPTAVIDTILPKNTEEDFPILFRGHGQDQDGSIIAYEWKRWNDVVFGSQPVFVTTLPQSPEFGNIISFKVQDNDSAWSDAVTQSVTVLPVGTLLRDWYFPPDEPLHMGSWYDLSFSTHNLNQEHSFDVLYGLQYEYSPSVPGFQHLVKLNVDHSPKVPSSYDYGAYTWGDTVLYSLPAGGIAIHHFGVRTHWDWIAPWGLGNVLSAILNFLPGVGQSSSLFGDVVKWFSEGAADVSKLLGLFGQIRAATGMILNSDTYVTYQGLCNSAPGTPKQLHYVVPIEKFYTWVIYVGLGQVAGKITLLPPWPFGLNYIIQVGMLIADQFVYQAAYDPDSNYTELVSPQFYFPPQLDSIPNEEARAAAYEVFRGVAYAEALKKSYAKYQGALLDENEEWAAKQLSSVALYSHLTSQTLQFLPSFLETLIVEPTQEQIDSMQNSFATHGLPDLEESILAQYGYQQQSMDSMAAGYAALADEYYMDAHQVPGLFQQAIGYLDSLPIYFPELPGNAKIADLGMNPSTLYLNNPPAILNCWVEFPKDSNITGYQIISAILNDTIQASYISPTPGDYDNDGIPDIAIQFSTTTLIPMLQPGQRLLSVLGDVVLPSADTVLYSGAALLTILEFLRGDANGDGVIDISDVVYLLNYLFIHGPAPVPILDAGDANCDSVVDASDLVYLLNYLFAHGPAPSC